MSRRPKLSVHGLTLVPASWFSWDFRVLDEGGAEVAVIDRHSFRERASFLVGGREHTVRRTSVLHGTFVLEESGRVLAEATKPSSFRRLFELAAGPNRYTLRAVSAMRREFELVSGGTPVGRIKPVSAFGRKATAEFTSDIPRELQLFVVFLVLVLWKRAQDAAAS